MRLLADQDVYDITIRYLRAKGHDVVTASELGLSKVSDLEMIQEALADQRILVTRDRDFGGLIFVNVIHCGVIYLRIGPTALDAVHDELFRVLGTYDEAELLTAFVVVEPGRHRLRRIVH